MVEENTYVALLYSEGYSNAKISSKLAYTSIVINIKAPE